MCCGLNAVNISTNSYNSFKMSSVPVLYFDARASIRADWLYHINGLTPNCCYNCLVCGMSPSIAK